MAVSTTFITANTHQSQIGPKLIYRKQIYKSEIKPRTCNCYSDFIDPNLNHLSYNDSC